ncbi:hypothetical protein [Konateibacter massiliensis]|uniref:hypothetical protein n=1 Tax=Konateibacter massiliensis TaxID=2002841 RepID=UPI000C151E35|nr:hypothetical protein [Konateibacter massiliensis]
MKKYLLATFLIVLTLIGCSSANNNSKTEDTSNTEKVSDDLKNIFETNGYTFSSENANKNILEGDRINITLNDAEDLQVFIYDSIRNADLDSQRISSDGFSYTKDEMSSSIDWSKSPHFYKYNNLIILYLGNNEELLTLLTNHFGNQIAGE